jgi:hypothetical protein
LLAVAIPTFLGVTHDRVQVQQAYDTLGSRMQAFDQQASQCATDSDPLGCQRTADLTAAQAFVEFNSRLHTISFSGLSSSLANQLESDTQQVNSDLQDLANSTGSAQQYVQAVRQSNFQRDLNQFQSDYQALVASML